MKLRVDTIANAMTISGNAIMMSITRCSSRSIHPANQALATPSTRPTKPPTIAEA